MMNDSGSGKVSSNGFNRRIRTVSEIMFVPLQLRSPTALGEENFAGLGVVPGHGGPEKCCSDRDDPSGAGSPGGPEKPLHSDEPKVAEDAPNGPNSPLR